MPMSSSTPVVTRMQVVPVAGHDGMLLNLSGAHGPFFTRNIVILTDSAGRTFAHQVLTSGCQLGQIIRQVLGSNLLRGAFQLNWSRRAGIE